MPEAPQPPWQRALLTAGGLGLSRVMPGTVGSLGTAALIYGVDLGLGTVAGLCVAALLLVFGSLVTICFGDLGPGDGHGDPGWIVSDEVAGQALASLPAVWVGGFAAQLAAFVLFRLFDITKPGLRRLEQVHGGVGVLLDDLAAGGIAGTLISIAALSGLLPG